MEPKKYYYSGPVVQFDKVIFEKWKAETTAPTKKKAYSNLVYRFKKEHNMQPWVKIELSAAKLLSVEEKYA